MKIYLKRFIIFALTALLIIAPPVSYANTSIGGWTALDTITAGATNTINATKTAGGKVLQSAITIAPQAGKVGKYLLRGGAAGALALAVPQILGDGIDWVLDPANNSVKYTIPANVGIGSYSVQGYKSSSMIGACNAYREFVNGRNGYERLFAPTVEGNPSAGQEFFCIFPTSVGADSRVQGWAGESVISPEQNKSIPIDTVASQVISNAEAGDPSSQQAVKAVALEGFAAGEHDAALEAAATETGVENPPDTTDPDAPAEPFDPAGIISAINALKAMLAGILSSITSLSDFFQSDPPAEPTPTDTEVIIDSPLDDFDSDKSYITFTGSCPPNYTASLSIMGNTVPFSFDYAPICTVMSALKPFIIGAGYLSAAYIISGVGRSTSKE